jgi:dipeptidyl aminopeptidase/acylaminoacyl peptidase
MPIVARNGQESNDTYVEQLVASAEAAVDTLVAMGVADRSRIGIGGHSYGAFMTANLLAHSDIFRAGIARSGAYNRTLTPFGFQAEERTFWEAPEVYEKMSPFTYANRIKEPILLIHGEADDNSGTFPIQTERMYSALKGNGGTARYVVLPAEAHGYRARESVGHTLYEMVSWMDRYVKGSGAALTP